MLRKSATLTAVTVGAAMLATTATAQYKPLDGDPKEINFGIIPTESTQNLKQAWVPPDQGHADGAGHAGEAVLRARLCRRHRSHAVR